MCYFKFHALKCRCHDFQVNVCCNIIRTKELFELFFIIVELQSFPKTTFFSWDLPWCPIGYPPPIPLDISSIPKGPLFPPFSLSVDPA